MTTSTRSAVQTSAAQHVDTTVRFDMDTRISFGITSSVFDAAAAALVSAFGPGPRAIATAQRFAAQAYDIAHSNGDQAQIDQQFQDLVDCVVA